MTKRKASIYLVIATLCWSGNYIFGKYVVKEMTPVQMVFSRWLIATLILLPLAIIIEKPKWKMILIHWKSLIISSLTGLVLYNYLLYKALKYTTSLNASLIGSLNPLLIAICAAWFLKERLTKQKLAGFLISLFGVLFVITEGHLTSIFERHYNFGDLLMFGAISMWTIYSLICKQYTGLPPISTTAICSLFGVIMLVPFILFSNQSFPLTTLSTNALIGIIYIGIFPSVVSFLCWNAGILVLGASYSGVYLSLSTLFTAIISCLLGNPIHLSQIIGGILIFTGIVITSKSARKKIPNIKDNINAKRN